MPRIVLAADLWDLIERSQVLFENQNAAVAEGDFFVVPGGALN